MSATFDKLSIDEQVQFVNAELQKDKKISVTKLFKKFGFNKSTILSRFTREGYKFNPDIRAYTKDILIQNDNKCITNKVEAPKNNIVTDSKELKELKSTLKEVKELLEMKEQLKEVIQYYNKSKNVIDVPEPTELKIDSNEFNGELKGRLIKVYENVNDAWIKFCKDDYPMYKMQDLYSMALAEFMKKYKK